jgi:hypothetical protein
MDLVEHKNFFFCLLLGNVMIDSYTGHSLLWAVHCHIFLTKLSKGRVVYTVLVKK